jgi:hypothetical protein
MAEEESGYINRVIIIDLQWVNFSQVSIADIASYFCGFNVLLNKILWHRQSVVKKFYKILSKKLKEISLPGCPATVILVWWIKFYPKNRNFPHGFG